ncbi:MAG: Bcr/CflA family drug resistance efflux transporter, partial [Pseudomonadota bacterium]
IVLCIVSIGFLGFALLFEGVPPLWSFMVWLLVSTFCLGMLFGNFNALAMEPVGHMAGLGAAVNGSFSTFLALPSGWAIGAAFDGTVVPVIAGFAILSLFTLVLMGWIERGNQTVSG